MAAIETDTGSKIAGKDKISTETQDVEKAGSTLSCSRATTEDVPRAKMIRDKVAVLRHLGNLEAWLDQRIGVETQGIDRIPEDKKNAPSLLNAFLMWFSFNGHVATLPVGLLGPEFGLSLQLSVVAIVVGTLLGSFFPAYCATLGPKLGLRAIATSRYSFGFWGAKVCAVINIVVNVGFAVVSLVLAGQLLSAVSDYKMTIDVGCVIVSLVSYLISFAGFGMIHTFEKYMWILAFILECVLVGQAAPHIATDTPSSWSGLELSAAFLTFMAISFAYAAAWASTTSDYYCNYLSTTPRWKIFTLTYAGLSISTIFTLTIGACVGNAVFTYAPWTDAYDAHGLGGAMGEMYHPNAWSKFALVMSTFTVLGTLVASNYSAGLAAQLVGDYFHAVPRLIWSFLAMVVALVLAVAGHDYLSTILSNFCSMLGYWSVCFAVILFLEDQWFRRKDGYDLHAWDDPKALPMGIAAVGTLVIGYCVGGVLGMDQTWFVGPIAKAFGGIGGDVGIYLCFVISIIVYWPLRTLEKSMVKR
ncbi:permease for cytosine/purines, uracil, thiamine, allantoin-domain-containing protein [Exophiala viscosa]|uniref:Permease for cytosine/purines, uracil, thiamine, allantoin-domain-containing protein n=1 Tax=Exophiala viscosa TaxID=2486360 RepID=A0AAN6E0V4_9EURO|nr:permease for cytosine/purines, uracil, thiamine, allantoin-domain-containing protein [Exophiala viscosa]KAI1624193.1 permease for cytosine/purines, uracil, thiamine, allantoin-domain-containing protein [Exophiala viscosa]